MIARVEPRETGSTADARRLHHLDWLRILAILMVLLSHAVNPLISAIRYFLILILLLLRFPCFSPRRMGHGYHLWFLAFSFLFALITLPFFLWLKKKTGQRYLALFVVQWETGIGVRLRVVALSSFFVSIDLYELIIRRISILRLAFGMKSQSLQNA